MNDIMRESVENGQYYMHFKGYMTDTPDVSYIYKILESNAKHCDDQERYVVYQNIITGEVWIRLYNEFTSKIDRTKYTIMPECVDSRFTKIDVKDVKNLLKKSNIVYNVFVNDEENSTLKDLKNIY